MSGKLPLHLKEHLKSLEKVRNLGPELESLFYRPSVSCRLYSRGLQERILLGGVGEGEAHAQQCSGNQKGC